MTVLSGKGRGLSGTSRRSAGLLALLCAVVLLPTSAAAASPPGDTAHGLAWQLTPTGSTERLRGLSAVSSRVAWASGSAGTVLRTVDSGRSWQRVSPPDTGDLLFRDIEAFDADHAVVLAIGPGDASRVYVTADGGAQWTLAFRNDDERAFYDCMAFFDRRRGIAMSDPVDGKFRIVATDDGGRSWRVQPTSGMPAALPGEAGFAASGQCVTTAGRDAWFGTGGGEAARVFHSRDGGVTWTVSDTGMGSGASAGVFALAFRDPRHGVAVGGDFATPDQAVDAFATSRDGGRDWRLTQGAVPAGFRSGVTWLNGHTLIAVGETGSDVSTDGGHSWRQFDTGSFDTVDCAHGTCWATGTAGRAAHLG